MELSYLNVCHQAHLIKTCHLLGSFACKRWINILSSCLVTILEIYFCSLRVQESA